MLKTMIYKYNVCLFSLCPFRIGYQLPIFAGFCIMFLSTISKFHPTCHHCQKNWMLASCLMFLLSVFFVPAVVKCSPSHRATLCCFWPDHCKVWAPPAPLWQVRPPSLPHVMLRSSQLFPTTQLIWITCIHNRHWMSIRSVLQTEPVNLNECCTVGCL